MKTLLASAAILSLLAAGTAVAGSKMSGTYSGDSPRMQMSDSDDRMGHSGDRRGYKEYNDDDDRSAYMRDRRDDDREHSNRSQRGFERMDTNGDGMISRQEFMTHMQDRDRS